MGAADISASDMDRGCDHLLWGDHMHQKADSGDIRDRVGGAHLVEVDLLDGLSVDVGLGLGDQAVDCHDVVLYLFREV